MPASNTYREPTVKVEDEEEDLDDLDDVLASFNKPASATKAKRPAPVLTTLGPTPTQNASSPNPNPNSKSTHDIATTPSVPALQRPVPDDEMDASLEAGMEELLRSLALSNPPGPMPDLQAGSSESKSEPWSNAPRPLRGSGDNDGNLGGMSPEEEERAWQRAMEMLLSQDGINALGLNENSVNMNSPGARASATGNKQAGSSDTRARGSSGTSGGTGQGEGAPPPPPPPPPPSFEETIRRAMEGINAGGNAAGAGTGSGVNGENNDHAAGLARLLQQLAADPSALAGDDDDDDDELGGLLDGMMTQLMSKDVLEEPMVELSSKYPGYLASPPTGVSKEDLDKYRAQHRIVIKIVDTFKRPGYSDEKDGKEVARLVSEMQDLGGPPNEIMGDLPEGFDLGALGALGGSDENCVIM